MRILIVSSYLQGILFFRKELIKFLLSTGHSVDIIAPTFDVLNNGKDIKKQFSDLGVNVYNLKLTRKSFVLGDEFNALRQLKTLASTTQYDTIVFFFPKSYYFLRAATLTVNAQKISVIDGLGKYYTKYRGENCLVSIKKYLMRLFLTNLLKLNKLDGGNLCVLNQSDFNYLSKNLPSLNITLLPFKGSTPRYAINKFRPLKAVYIGRITYEKGYLDLRQMKMKLGSELKIFGKYDEGINNSDRIKIDGWTENVLEVLSKAKFLVLPSYREGLSTIVQEAFSQGCVVVAYDVPGVKDLITSGETGFLVKPGDYMSILQIIELTRQELIDDISQRAMLFHKKNLNEIKNVKNIYYEMFQ